MTYEEYKAECEKNGWFVLNYMNWSASKKYEENKERFQQHFQKMHEEEKLKEEKLKEEKDAGQGREETAPE